MGTHVSAQILQRPEPLRTQRAEDLSMGIVTLQPDVQFHTITDPSHRGRRNSTTVTKCLFHHSVDEVSKVWQVAANPVLLLKQGPVRGVHGRLVSKAGQSGVKRSVTEVAFERQVDAVLFEVS